jgi:hypothetical protein
MADENYEVQELVQTERNGHVESKWVPINTQAKIDRILQRDSPRKMNIMDKIDNRPLFDLTSQNLNRVGDMNVSEKIRRMLE